MNSTDSKNHQNKDLLKTVLQNCIKKIKEQEARHGKKDNLKKEIRDYLSEVNF